MSEQNLCEKKTLAGRRLPVLSSGSDNSNSSTSLFLQSSPFFQAGNRSSLYATNNNDLNEDLEESGKEEEDEADMEEEDDESPSFSGDTPVEVDLSQSYLNDATVAGYLMGDDRKAENVVALSLAHNELQQLPVTICLFKNLVSLDLSNNQLLSLPDDICQLTRLRSLSARNNALDTLPKSIQLLNGLEELNISGNNFEHVPPVVFEMRELRALYLGANRIDYLPPVIARLSNLEILYLGGNRLTEVPASLGRLSKLTSLILADNQLETLPPTFADLEALQSLTLHNNNIRALPTGLAKLQNLQHLSLRNNPLVTNFVNDVRLMPPTLQELAARVVKIHSASLTAGISAEGDDDVARLAHLLPVELVRYLRSANHCINPRCRGVYFESCAELVKFVDFCGKYRVPLMQYLCSPRCTNATPAYAFSDDEAEDDDIGDVDAEGNNNAEAVRMRRVLLG